MIHLPVNERPAERVARVIVGIVFLCPWWDELVGIALAVVLWALAAFALFTGLTGWCPLYSVLGIDVRDPRHPGAGQS